MKKPKGHVIWLTGLSGSGKTTLATALRKRLQKMNVPVHGVDGDVARQTFSKDLGFAPIDRALNCSRAAHVASYLKDFSIVICSFISPLQEMRDYARQMADDKFIEVWVNCPISTCIERDPKGMYARLVDGKLDGSPFTGMHPEAHYVQPEYPEIVVHTDVETVDQSVDKIISYLEENDII